MAEISSDSESALSELSGGVEDQDQGASPETEHSPGEVPLRVWESVTY